MKPFWKMVSYLQWPVIILLLTMPPASIHGRAGAGLPEPPNHIDRSFCCRWRSRYPRANFG